MEHHAEQEHIEEYRKLGVHKFTQKPLTTTVILDVYHTYLATMA